jgi:excisionase family DNA binding protein
MKDGEASVVKNRWLSVEEICRYVGVRRETVYRWIGSKGFPAHRVGKLWKFKVKEVDDWIRGIEDKGKMRKASISLQSKREEILNIAKKHGAERVRIIGSYARGEMSEESDIDILVEMDEGRSLLDLVSFTEDLEEFLGRKVHVLTEGGISPHLKDKIYGEAVPL